MKKTVLYILVAVLATGLMSHTIAQNTSAIPPVEKLLNETPSNKLPMLVILNNMDVQNWSKNDPDSPKFFHQYKIITNADNPRKVKVTTLDFIPVDRKTFLRHYNHLDMTVGFKTKAKTSTIVAPSGYVLYVGNKKYGKWRLNKKNGQTIWKFYKKHQPLAQACGLTNLVIHSYSFTDYDKNYREKRPYYGDKQTRFGTGSKFSKSIQRTDSFYQSKRQTQVETFYQNKDLINNAHIQYPVDDLLKIAPEKLPMLVILYDMDVREGVCFNKYKVITNIDDPYKIKRVVTPWKKVSKKDFLKNYQNLGMELASKHKDEKGKITTLKIPSPAGYSNYIGNPKYGQWQTYNEKTSWSFYGKYMFLSMMFDLEAYPAYKNSYITYRKNCKRHQVYYGETKSNPTYGTGSAYVRKVFSRTYYSKHAKRCQEFYQKNK